MKYSLDKKVRIIDKNIVGTISNVSAATGEKPFYGVFSEGKIYENIPESNLVAANKKPINQQQSEWAKKGRKNLLDRLGSPEAVTKYFQDMVAKRKDRKNKIQ